jgi:drug/metabolite transporter (DMT)-like permease
MDPIGLASAFGGAGLWGLSFVAPVFMPGINPWDVSLGRYLIYGVIGALLLWRQCASGARLTRRDWAHAFAFAATGYYGCYTALVYAIEYAGPALPSLVMGLTPVSVAVVGNLRRREVPFTRLAGPLTLIALGLAAVNLARQGGGLSTYNMEIGLAYSLLALALLTYFLVANLLFLKRRPQITPLVWADAIGSALLLMALLALLVRLAHGGGTPWAGTSTSFIRYALGSATLGFGASWLGGVLWNRASASLPATVVGQCIVFWPISGVAFAYMVQGRLPSAAEAAGMVLTFAGILWGLRSIRPARSSG